MGVPKREHGAALPALAPTAVVVLGSNPCCCRRAARRQPLHLPASCDRAPRAPQIGAPVAIKRICAYLGVAKRNFKKACWMAEKLDVPVAATAGCHCLAMRQAARRVTHFYDGVLAPTGLRTTQFSILA